jgi:hypothetical protein
MTEHFLEMEDAATFSQIVDCKGVSHGMNAPFGRLESQGTAQTLKITQNVPAPLLRPTLSSKDQTIPGLGFSLKKEQAFSEFKGNWDQPVFAPLSMQQNEQVVEVHVFPVKAQCLINSAASVRDESNERG